MPIIIISQLACSLHSRGFAVCVCVWCVWCVCGVCGVLCACVCVVCVFACVWCVCVRCVFWFCFCCGGWFAFRQQQASDLFLSPQMEAFVQSATSARPRITLMGSCINVESKLMVDRLELLAGLPEQR
jgi:hypothetical protein